MALLSRKLISMKKKMCRPKTVVLVLFVLAVIVVAQASSALSGGDVSQQRGIVSIVLIGATGDLAKKYLWQGFFNLVQEEEPNVIEMYAGARSPQDTGAQEIRTILQNNVSCARVPSHVQHTPEQCQAAKTYFMESIPYYQLKKEADYASLCGDILHQTQSVGLKEAGRLFYLSVPPFAYAEIAAYINKECRPGKEGWLRVVVEKPFGDDSASAKELSKQLKQHLKEHEIYRIDHYLGKTGVQSILPFRALNSKTYEWNSGGIERVEIVMKEALDVKGRISFYDKYGVIRDVMQNHLTEIMALVAMETPANLSSIHDFQREKLALLSQVDHLTSQQAVIGQYDGYMDEWRSEMRKGEYETSRVPTFAAVLLSVSSPRWDGVPFVMVSGKKMDKKEVYVKILFKNKHFCPVTPSYDDGDHACRPKQIIFFIGSSELPTVAISKSLPKPVTPGSWTIADLDPDVSILGIPKEDFYLYRAGPENDAYSVLIRESYLGHGDKFIGTSELTASWDVWTPLLEDLRDVSPRIYPGGAATGRWLDVEIKDRDLLFSIQVDSEWDTRDLQRFGMPTLSGVGDKFRSDPLFTGSAEETVGFLARHLLASAREAIEERGAFHVAFPGGRTPELLLMHLFLRMRHDFPWRRTHVWFVDERCVAHTSKDSNFQLIYSKLLKYVSIPHTSIHPMPVQLANGLCSDVDNGAQIYAAEMERLVPQSCIDYVILGVGGDRHVASLFPQQETLLEDKHLVALTQAPKGSKVSKRMTLTYAAINSARTVSVLILGEEKHSLVQRLKQEHISDRWEMPVLGVQLKEGNLTWFIDHDALL